MQQRGQPRYGIAIGLAGQIGVASLASLAQRIEHHRQFREGLLHALTALPLQGLALPGQLPGVQVQTGDPHQQGQGSAEQGHLPGAVAGARRRRFQRQSPRTGGPAPAQRFVQHLGPLQGCGAPRRTLAQPEQPQLLRDLSEALLRQGMDHSVAQRAAQQQMAVPLAGHPSVIAQRQEERRGLHLPHVEPQPLHGLLQRGQRRRLQPPQGQAPVGTARAVGQA